MQKNYRIKRFGKISKGKAYVVKLKNYRSRIIETNDRRDNSSKARIQDYLTGKGFRILF